MGTSHRLAAVAAASHARQYFNHTQPEVAQTELPQYNVGTIFFGATLCGVLLAVCAACWHRAPPDDKPEDPLDGGGVYTVSRDLRLDQMQHDYNGPPPAYDTVVTVDDHTIPKDCSLQEVITEPCPHCHSHDHQSTDSGLPSYEAAVLLRDTKL